MTRKPKFKPVITRVKLNPEQAVLWCACHTGTRVLDLGRSGTYGYGLEGGPHCSAFTGDRRRYYVGAVSGVHGVATGTPTASS